MAKLLFFSLKLIVMVHVFLGGYVQGTYITFGLLIKKLLTLIFLEGFFLQVGFHCESIKTLCSDWKFIIIANILIIITTLLLKEFDTIENAWYMRLTIHYQSVLI